MTKIRTVSDLHLEFYKNDDFILEKTDDEKNSILVLAGDICKASSEQRFKYFFKDISNRFKHIIYVMGNHEYYGSSIIMTPDKLELILSGFKNIHILENDIFKYEDLVFIGATLWTDLGKNDPICIFDAKRYMNDFKIIRMGPADKPWLRKFTPEDSYVMHERSLEYITNILENKDPSKKYILVNHHAQSYQSIHPAYQGDKMNGLYASDLSEMIFETQPHLVIHGHTHTSFDYMIGHSRIICNPFGYVGHEENLEFNPKLTIEL